MKKIFLMILLFLLCGCENLIVSKPQQSLQCFNGHVYYANIRLMGYVFVTPIYDENGQLIPCSINGEQCKFDTSKINKNWGEINF